jgi:hypothetical protein
MTMAYVVDITINGILNLVAKACPLNHLPSLYAVSAYGTDLALV